MLARLLSLLFIVSVFCPQIGNAEIGFPETLTLNGRTLVRNGTGVRTATLFALKVYEGALYVEKKSSDPNALIESREWKEIQMRFLRDVDAKKLKAAFREGIEDNSKKADAVEAETGQLTSLIRDVKEGDVLVISFFDDHVAVRHNAEERGSIPGRDFVEALLSVWLGPKPPNKGLKDGLLGLSKN